MSNIKYSSEEIDSFFEEEKRKLNESKILTNATPDSPLLSNAEIDNFFALEKEKLEREAQTFDVPYDTVDTFRRYP